MSESNSDMAEGARIRLKNELQLATSLDLSQSRVRVSLFGRRDLSISEVLSYTLGVALITGVMGWLLSGSPRILIPVAAVCAAGAIVGTLVAILRSLEERERSASELAEFEALSRSVRNYHGLDDAANFPETIPPGLRRPK
jgi:hypothetical protein